MAKKPTYGESEQRIKQLEQEAEKRKRAEEALHESEERYREIASSIPGVVYQFLLKRDGSYASPYMSESASAILDISAEEVIANPYSLFDRIMKEDLDSVNQSIAESAKTMSTWLQEFRIKTTTGETRWVRATSTPHSLPDGETLWNGVILDISDRVRAEEALQRAYEEMEQRVQERTAKLAKTAEQLKLELTQRKQVEEALRESEEKYRLLVENANDAIFIAQDEVVKFSNPKTEEMIGYSAEELAAIPFVDLIHHEDRQMVLDRHKRRLEGTEPPSIYSFRIIERGGRELWVQLNVVYITWEGRPATLNLLRDITPQKRLEAQLLQAHKMEAIGTLAGGVAHDFNNLLMGIQGNVSLMLLDTDTSHPHYERLRNIEYSVRSGAELTRQLLGFAMGGKYRVKPADLNEIVRKTSGMFGRTKREIAIHTKYQKGIWPVEVDRDQIEQVLLNLYVNAWQAMSGGGNLYLQTENTTLDENYVKTLNIAPGRYVKISLIDTGVGMDKATQQRIFEPFFTTKEMGRGTGLGLASVYGIIKNHAGIIKVFSEKGEGTTFDIYLPVSGKEVGKENELPEEILKGTETILFVDDEEMIIDVGGEILKILGYNVLLAESGKEAIKLYETNRDKIDMVILDMVMPDMGGGKTYDRLKEINPDIKILLSSGYSINGQATEILERGCDGFIQKPFDVKELSRKIREILDKQ